MLSSLRPVAVVELDLRTLLCGSSRNETPPPSSELSAFCFCLLVVTISAGGHQEAQTSGLPRPLLSLYFSPDVHGDSPNSPQMWLHLNVLDFKCLPPKVVVGR